MRRLSSGEKRSGGVGREVHGCYCSGGNMFRLRWAMEGNKVCSVRDLQTGGVLWATRDGDYWQVARRAKAEARAASGMVAAVGS
jgi:hypothetical protein